MWTGCSCSGMACIIDSCCSCEASSIEDIVRSIAGATGPEEIRLWNAMRSDCCKLKVMRKRSLYEKNWTSSISITECVDS